MGKPVKVYHHHRGPGDEQKTVELNASSLFGEQGEVVGIVETLRQIPYSAISHQLTVSESGFGRAARRL